MFYLNNSELIYISADTAVLSLWLYDLLIYDSNCFAAISAAQKMAVYSGSNIWPFWSNAYVAYLCIVGAYNFPHTPLKKS